MNMYQKKIDRKNKPEEEKDNSHKTNINWGIGTYRQQPLNTYKD